MRPARTNRHGLHRTLSIAALAGLLAVACSSGGVSEDLSPTSTTSTGGPDDTVEIGDVELIASLERYNSCDAFLADVKAEALERVGPYGLGGGGGWGWPMPAEGDMVARDSVGGADEGAPDLGGGGEFSGTNVQEEGVDEPDIAKTDGSLLAYVNDIGLHLVDVSNPASPVLLHSDDLDGNTYGTQLLLHGDTLVLLQQGSYPMEPLEDDVEESRIAPGPSWFREESVVTQYDVSNPGAPRVVRAWRIEGGYVSARLTDGVMRLVVASTPAHDMPFVYPSTPAAEDAATAANRAVVEATTIEDWLPVLRVTDGDGDVVASSASAPCDRLYRPSVFSGFGLVSVLTADLDAGGLADGSGVGLLSSGEIVYASTTALYVATTKWEPSDGPTALAEDGALTEPAPGSQRTDIHRFSLSGDEPASYEASGSVEGHLLNQFSMSEFDGHLRVAVTKGSWGDESSSAVVVLRQGGDRLDEIGSVDGLGAGEQIYAVRFIGDRGYVVTFRQVDPLYVIDLSIPSDPRVTGELKIPGYSAYLHPVGEHLLLGVGQDADDEGRTTGTQVSLFDVSNPASPQRLAQLGIGSDASSEVEYDHHAFLYWDGLAVVPFSSWRWDPDTGDEDLTTSAVAIDVDEIGLSLTERGRLSHAPQVDGGSGGYVDHYGSTIRRSIVIGDTLLTLSQRGVLASDLTTLATSGWLALPTP